MTDNKQPDQPIIGGGGEAAKERVRPSQGSDPVRPTGTSFESAGGSGGEAVRQLAAAAAEAGDNGADVLRRGGEAAAHATRQAGEAGARATDHLGARMGEAVHRGGEAVAERQRQVARTAAEQFEEVGRKLAQAAHERTEDMQGLMVLRNAAGTGLNDMQAGLTGLIEGVMRTNLQATQDLLRLANPGGFIDLQRRFMHDYLGALMGGSAILIRAARRAADQTLRPLEEQIEQRGRHRQAQGGQEDGQAGQSDREQQWRANGRVRDVMSTHVRIAKPDDPVQHAARLMREEDTGMLPVGEGDRLVGIVTDRDVALRLVADGKDAARTKVREVMTQEVRYVFEDEAIGHVAENMAEQQVRRLPVVNREKRLVGVVSLGDLTREGRLPPHLAGQALGGISQEGGRHGQRAAG